MGRRAPGRHIIVSKRRLISLGGSKAVTLSAKWLQLKKLLGREVYELISVANDMILLVPPEKKERAIKALEKLEEEMET